MVLCESRTVLKLASDIRNGVLASHFLKDLAEDTATTRAPPVELHSQDPSNSMIDIYQAFTLSVSSLLLWPLVKGEEWIPLGSDSCLRTYHDPTGWATITNCVQWLRIDIRWTPSGVLTIASRLRCCPSFSPLVDVLECEQDPHSEPLGNGVRILLLPFGSRCMFLGEESRILGAIKLERPFNISTRAWLREYGISMERESRWVYLELGKNDLCDNNSSNSAAVSRVWWPAHLCFIKHTSRKQGDSQMLQSIVTGNFLDPLQDVEKWFLGRQEREAIIETRRKEVEETKFQTNQALNQEDSEIEDDGADAMTQANQYLSAQEASGIYPTPPDGLTSNAQGSIAAQHTPSASIAGGHPYNDAISEAAHGEIAEIDSPNRAMPRAPFAEDENQDFFGDMGADMFDTHNLTEADFNFFDEPDETDEVQAEFTEPDAQNAEDMRIDDSDGELSDVFAKDAVVSEMTPLASENVIHASVERSKILPAPDHI